MRPVVADDSKREGEGEKTLGVPKSDLQILQGSKSRDKTVSVSATGLRSMRSKQQQQQQQAAMGDEDLVARIRALLLAGS